MKTYQKLGSVLALGLGFSAAADSAILYNNLPEPPLTLSNVLAGGISLGGGAGGWVANSFSTDAFCLSGCTLGDITLALYSPSGSSAGFTLSLYSDSYPILSPYFDPPNGTLPVAQIGSNFATPTDFPTQNGFRTFTPNEVITLANNTTYWVELKYTAEALPAQWLYTSGFGNNVDSDGNNWHDFPPMMKVEATVAHAPLPAAAWLMGSGLMGFLWAEKKRFNRSKMERVAFK